MRSAPIYLQLHAAFFVPRPAAGSINGSRVNLHGLTAVADEFVNAVLSPVAWRVRIRDAHAASAGTFPPAEASHEAIAAFGKM
jgi:hypothetical protein